MMFFPRFSPGTLTCKLVCQKFVCRCWTWKCVSSMSVIFLIVAVRRVSFKNMSVRSNLWCLSLSLAYLGFVNLMSVRSVTVVLIFIFGVSGVSQCQS